MAGCARGIGARVATQLFHAGARLVGADLDDAAGQSLIDDLNRDGREHHNAIYAHVDVSDYNAIYALFNLALRTHGRVDMAIHCAAITEIGGWFSPGVDFSSVENVSVF